jgi:hypothetical protein
MFFLNVLLSVGGYPLTAPVAAMILHREMERPPGNHLEKNNIS